MSARTVGLIAALLVIQGAGSGAGGENRAGLGATLALGTNIGVVLKDADYIFGTDLDPSFGMRLGLLYRFGDWLGLGLDYTFGMFDAPERMFGYFMAIEANPRVFFPAGPVDIFLEVGLGWNMLWRGMVGDANTQLHGFGVGFGLGAEYRITEYLSAGVSARYHLPVFLEDCFEEPGILNRTCREWGGEEIDNYIHEVMVGANLTFYFYRLGGKSEPADSSR